MHHSLSPAPNPYFRFPLASLSYAPQDPYKTINTALDYCLYDVGSKLRETLRDEYPKVHDLQNLIRESAPEKYSQVSVKGSENELCVVLGAIKLRVSLGCSASTLKYHNQLVHHLQQQDRSSQRNMVTVTSDVLWQCFYYLSGEPLESWLTWNEFRVLCAIASKVGASKFAKCSWAEIQARAAGWCGKANMAKANETEMKRRQPLIMSRTTIRRHLTNLEATQRFACFKHGKGRSFGESWYSYSMSREELRSAVLSRKSRKADTIADQRQLDAEASSNWHQA